MAAAGLSAAALKYIALVSMTLDHIGLWCNLFGLENVGLPLRIIGRIAAPVFLFLLTESLRFTRSRPKLLLRLYLAAVLHAVLSHLLILKTGEREWCGNILPTFFYTALIVSSIENLRAGKPTLLLGAAAFWAAAAYLAPTVPYLPLLLPRLRDVEYSALFVLLGVVWYFLPRRNLQLLIFLLTGLASWLIPAQDPWIERLGFSPMFYGTQPYMLLALPLLALYNGEKGRSSRAFFYWYYPLHQYALLFFSFLIKNA